jgi:hypothetical protein
MGHGRKSRPVLSGGCKRHMPRGLDTGLVPAAGIILASAAEASVTGDIAAGLTAGRAAHRPGLPGLRTGPRPEPGPGHLLQGLAGPQRRRWFAMAQFTLDSDARRLTCPAGMAMPFEPGRAAAPATWEPARTCPACGAPPSSMTAASSPARPSPTVIGQLSDGCLAGVLGLAVTHKGFGLYGKDGDEQDRLMRQRLNARRARDRLSMAACAGCSVAALVSLPREK